MSNDTPPTPPTESLPDSPQPDRLMSSVMSMAQDAVDRLEKFRGFLIRFHSDQNRSAANMARWQDRAAVLLTLETDDAP